MKNPKVHLIKNGTGTLKGTRSETGIDLFRIVGNSKPTINQPKFEVFKNQFTSRQCKCNKSC